MPSACLGDDTPLTNQGQERLWTERQFMKQGVKQNGSIIFPIPSETAGPVYCRMTQYLRSG